MKDEACKDDSSVARRTPIGTLREPAAEARSETGVVDVEAGAQEAAIPLIGGNEDDTGRLAPLDPWIRMFGIANTGAEFTDAPG
ncbi:hypothetical protein [Burkholderia anthina]|uniref:hypothetical protein n=1 Tax=Burkholderia anthina TaxID=179879 RepID=UPI00158B04B7|nr:hypothetical protein [Burkholderia anthina]